jgi:hypothetical protein
MTRLIFGLIAVAFVGGAAQAGPLGFLKNLRQKPQQNNQPAAQQANPAPAQPAAVPVGRTARIFRTACAIRNMRVAHAVRLWRGLFSFSGGLRAV